jgi:hypothetical protein
MSRLLKAVVARFPNGSINVFDRDLRYVFAAGEGLAAVGLSSASLIGRTLDELFPAGEVASVKPFLERAFEGQAVQFEVDAFGRTYIMSAGPLDDPPVEQIIAVAQEISPTRDRAGSHSEPGNRAPGDHQDHTAAVGEDGGLPLGPLSKHIASIRWRDAPLAGQFEALTASLLTTQALTSRQKQVALQLLETVFEQWAKSPGQRRSAAAMNFIVDGFARTVAEAADVRQIWTSVEPHLRQGADQ